MALTIIGNSVHYPGNLLLFHIDINRVKTKKIVKELEDGILNEDQLYLAHGKNPFGLNDYDKIIQEVIERISK